MTTKRKPYVRPMTSTWWKKLPFYRFYMLREGTAVPAVWFSIELIFDGNPASCRPAKADTP